MRPPLFGPRPVLEVVLTAYDNQTIGFQYTTLAPGPQYRWTEEPAALLAAGWTFVAVAGAPVRDPARGMLLTRRADHAPEDIWRLLVTAANQLAAEHQHGQTEAQRVPLVTPPGASP